MPPGLQANNLSPMGFGQPNMQVAAKAAGGPGYGMPARPVAPGQEPEPSAPPGGAGEVPPPEEPRGPTAMGVPALYQSPIGKQALRANPPSQFPADAVYNRVQSAILHPGPPADPAPPPPPPPMAAGPPPMPDMGMMPPPGPPMGMPPGPMPPMGPPGMDMMGGMPPPMGPMPIGPMMPGPMGPMGPEGGDDMASAIQWMQQQLGGLA